MIFILILLALLAVTFVITTIFYYQRYKDEQRLLKDSKDLITSLYNKLKVEQANLRKLKEAPDEKS